MKSHCRRPRPRREFLGLAHRIDPHFIREAWEQFFDSLNGQATQGTSFQEQFQILERLRLANARRDRYNRKRRFSKLWRARAFLRLNPRGVANFGMLLRIGGRAWTPSESREVISGLFGLDQRFSHKLARECEVIREWISTDRDPARIDSIPCTREDVTAGEGGRQKFLALLADTPVPAPPCPNTVAIDDDQGEIYDSQFATQEAAAFVASA